MYLKAHRKVMTELRWPGVERAAHVDQFDSARRQGATLRQVDAADLLSKAGTGVDTAAGEGERTLAEDDLGALFGLDNATARAARRNGLSTRAGQCRSAAPGCEGSMSPTLRSSQCSHEATG